MTTTDPSTLDGQGRTPPAGSSSPAALFVLVGGVPGAGKTTLLASTRQRLPHVRTLDTETPRLRLDSVFSGLVPYRWYRPLVHLTHNAHMLALLLRGPARRRHRCLVVHDPATRPRRRAVVAWIARWRGWDPVLVVLDVAREAAVAGQHRRGRVVSPTSFARHWARWSSERDALVLADQDGRAFQGWSSVSVVDRESGPEVLTHLLQSRVRPLDGA